MKKSTLAKMLLASGAMLAACTQEKLDDPVSDGPVPLKVSSNIVMTKAHDSSWDENDRIGISGTSGNTRYDNVSYTLTDQAAGTFAVTTEGEEIYFQNNDEVTFTAYYPYNESLTGTSIINVDSWKQGGQDGAKNMDFLWATGTGSKKNPSVKFAFNHKMTKIVLTVKGGDGFILKEVQDLVLTLDDFNRTGSFNTADGSTSTTSSAAAYNFAKNPTAEFNAPYTEDATGMSRTYTLILFPQEFNAVLDFTAVLPDAQSFATTLDFTAANTKAGDSPAKNEWKAGRQYNLTITLNKTAADVSADITGWDAVDMDGQTAE